MKSIISIFLAALVCLAASACAEARAPVALTPSSPDDAIIETQEASSMKLIINDTPAPVIWEDNPSVEALKALAPLTIEMSMYGGFEQVGAIGRSIPRSDAQITTAPGDIVLYSGNQIVVFYGSNSWAYTRLGRVDLDADALEELLGNGDVTLTLAL